MEKCKVRPFKDCDELVEFWAKNYQSVMRSANTKPLIWVRGKDKGPDYLITGFDNAEADHCSCVFLEDSWIDMKDLFEKYVFLDGKPCGVEER